MEENSILVYAITERGPDIVHAKSNLSIAKLQEIALYHLLLVAQGTWHHKGVFILPIPIQELKESAKAIFYGFTVYDQNQDDPRTKHSRYGCVITFCPNEILSALDLIDLEDQFDDLLKNTNSYQNLQSEEFFSTLITFISQKINFKKKIELDSVNSTTIKQIN